MFDLSLGELLLTLGVGVMLVGRKDLPKVAHTAGYWVGRGVGTVQASRRNLIRFLAKHELTEMQNDFQRGLAEIEAIKNDLRYASDPRAFAQPAVLARTLAEEHATIASDMPSSAAAAVAATATTTQRVAPRAVPALADRTPSSPPADGAGVINMTTVQTASTSTSAPPLPTQPAGFASSAATPESLTAAANRGEGGSGGGVVSSDMMDDVLAEELLMDQLRASGYGAVGALPANKDAKTGS